MAEHLNCIMALGLCAVTILMGIRFPFDGCRYHTVSDEIHLLQSHQRRSTVRDVTRIQPSKDGYKRQDVGVWAHLLSLCCGGPRPMWWVIHSLQPWSLHL